LPSSSPSAVSASALRAVRRRSAADVAAGAAVVGIPAQGDAGVPAARQTRGALASGIRPVRTLVREAP
jgi:hypothetical protein